MAYGLWLISIVIAVVASILTASVVSGINVYLFGKISERHRDNDYLTEVINACPIP